MKFKLGQKQLVYLIASIVIIASISAFFYYHSLPKKITRYNFYGTELQFRNDLRIAQNISVYPNDESIFAKVWDPNIIRVNIAYVPSQEPSEENSMLALSAFEIRFKLDSAYQNPSIEWGNEFTQSQLISFKDINQRNDTLVIALVRPSLADKTAVELDGNVVYIKGKTAQDFDLATIKFIMSALNITV